MKLKFKRTVKFTIDTAKERDRINRLFRGETKRMLNKFMDMFETGDMSAAGKELCSKWWKKRDKRLGCSRYEFIGLIFNHHLSNNVSYASLAFDIMNSRKGEWEIKKAGE